MTNYDRIKSKSTPEITFPAQAALNKSHHYLFRKMIYHYGMDFGQLMNIVLAAFAFGTFITAILTFRQTKEFEKQRIRPMMQAHLRMAEDPFSCAELVISNPGQTIVHNVKFEFLPDLPKTPPKKTPSQQKPSMAPKPTRHHPTTTPWRTNPNLGPRLRNNNAALVPQRRRQIRRLRRRHPRQNHNQNQLHRRVQKPTHYSDIFELNAVLLFGTTKPKTPVHRIQTGLQNIHQELKSLREGCGFPEANTSNPH